MRITNFNEDTISRLRGFRPSTEFTSNGCSCVPELLPHRDGDLADVSSACLFHDWHYYLGGSEADRRRADGWFFENLLELGATGEAALLYLRGVRLFGAFSFQYTPERGLLRSLIRRVYFASRSLVCG